VNRLASNPACAGKVLPGLHRRRRSPPPSTSRPARSASHTPGKEQVDSDNDRTCPGVSVDGTQSHQLTSLQQRCASGNRNGYLVREGVFTDTENDALRQVAEDIVDGKRAFPAAHIDRNALVTDGEQGRSGINAMHKIHHSSCYCPEFLARIRDPRLTDPLVDLLGPDILGINNLFIWKAPEIGLGFP